MKTKKSLGQHFLKNRGVVDDMLRAARLTASDTVLEAGPGRGVLTREILAHAGRVIAVEKDERLIRELRETFEGEIAAEKLELVIGDVLEFVPSRYKLTATSYKLVSNIPYYITGAFIRRFLSEDAQPQSMTLLVQKEVAERIAREEKESVLSISVKAYGTPRYVRTVKRGNFSPPPEIDSAILSIENISRDTFRNLDEGVFFALVKRGFSQKRKRLFSNLAALCSKASLGNAFSALSLDTEVRAEDVSFATWSKLARLLAPHVAYPHE